MTTVDDLREYQKALRTVKLEDKESFYQLFAKGLDLLKLLDDDVSGEFSVSRPTVSRWKNRRNAPHPLMRKPIYDWLEKRVDRLIKSLNLIAKKKAKTAPHIEPKHYSRKRRRIMENGPGATAVPKTIGEIQAFVDKLEGYNHYIGMVAPYRPGVKLCITRIEYELYTPDTPANDLLYLHMITWADGLWSLLSIPMNVQDEVAKIAQECGVKASANIPHSVTASGFEAFPIKAKNLFHFENTPGHPVYTNKPNVIEALQKQEQERFEQIVNEHYQMICEQESEKCPTIH